MIGEESIGRAGRAGGSISVDRDDGGIDDSLRVILDSRLLTIAGGAW